MRRWMALGGLVAVVAATVWLTRSGDDPGATGAQLPPPVTAPTPARAEGDDELADHLPPVESPAPHVAAATPAEEPDVPSPRARLDVLVRSADGVIPGATVTLIQDDESDAAGEPACPCTGGSDLRISDAACGDCPELVPAVLASVRAGSSLAPYASATSGSDGHATLELDEPVPRLAAWIEAPGYTPVTAGPFYPLNVQIEVRLHHPLRDGYRILGPDGYPLPNATAAAFSTHPFHAYAPRREGDVFWFEGVPSEYVLAALGGEPGLLPAVARAVNRAHPDGGTVDDLELESGTRLRVRLRQDGEAVASTPFELECNERRIALATDAHGRFEVWPAPASACDLLVRSAGLIARAPYSPDETNANPVVDLDLDLSAPGGIDGQVVDAQSGQPLSGVPVALLASGDSVPSGQLNPEFISHETDPSGRFRFDDLAPGTFEVLATLTGDTEEVAVEAGQRAQVTLRPQPTVEQ